MREAEILFDSYNKAFEEGFDAYVRDSKPEDLLKDMKAEDEVLKKHLGVRLEKWVNTPIPELEGKSPAQVVGSLDNFEAVLEWFKLGAMLCNDDLPAILTDKLRGYGDRAVEALLFLVSDRQLLSDREKDEYLIPVTAVKTLGLWKESRAAAPLIDLLLKADREDELLKESVRDALQSMGDTFIEMAVRELDGVDILSDGHEYLMMALSDTACTKRTDRIYQCLKKAFQHMHDKRIGAICLGRYGDGRAVPALRGYVERNRDHMDKETYYEIKAAVAKLGGTVDDIPVRFRSK